ncbi:MAG: class I SAM-dependent methyltransferase [Chitinophagaceae bacterium]|nr:MAG: class I SAM-dependent methyltransferase [Chitinophagaceae bacterium]
MKSGLKWTGERLVPTELHEIAVEHLARYAFCMPLMQSKTVLDLACGEGYGTHLLSQAAKEIIGVDIDRLTVAHAQARYGNGKTKFAEAPANKLPFEDSYFDVAVSFETLEHLYEQDEMIGEIKRVLKKDGALIISTPNKEEHSRISPEVNPFHAKELDKEEFKVTYRLGHLLLSPVKWLNKKK